MGTFWSLEEVPSHIYWYHLKKVTYHFAFLLSNIGVQDTLGFLIFYGGIYEPTLAACVMLMIQGQPMRAGQKEGWRSSFIVFWNRNSLCTNILKKTDVLSCTQYGITGLGAWKGLGGLYFSLPVLYIRKLRPRVAHVCLKLQKESEPPEEAEPLSESGPQPWDLPDPLMPSAVPGWD